MGNNFDKFIAANLDNTKPAPKGSMRDKVVKSLKQYEQKISKKGK